MSFQMNEELMQQNNLNEMFKVLNKYYDLDNCKPGWMIKAMLVPQLAGAMEKNNAVAKLNTGQLQTEMKIKSSITEIFQVLGKYYDLQSIVFTPIGKQNMLSKLQGLLTMVSAKQRRQNA